MFCIDITIADITVRIQSEHPPVSIPLTIDNISILAGSSYEYLSETLVYIKWYGELYATAQRIAEYGDGFFDSEEEWGETIEEILRCDELPKYLREQVRDIAFPKKRVRQGKQAKERVKKPGFVYLVSSGNGEYKIGRSLNVDARYDQLRKEYPMLSLELVYDFYADDYILAEKELHEEFADKAMGREWFSLDQSDVDRIIARES